jgi:hypothetical protein
MAEGDTISIRLVGSGGDAVAGAEWDAQALGELATGLDANATPWRLVDGPDWNQVALLRALSAGFEDGRALAVLAARPRKAEGHGDEAVAGVLLRDEEPIELAEVLLSAEYGPEGELRRVGLELYETEDSLPMRAAGDVLGGHTDRGDSIELEMRMGGVDGSGVIWTARGE